jgi:hypothetical protein
MPTDRGNRPDESAAIETRNSVESAGAEGRLAQDRALIQDAFRAVTRLAERLDPTTEFYQIDALLLPEL